MSTQPKRVTVSPSAREECIERVRKAIRSRERWGLWVAVFFLFMGLTFFALGVWLIVLLQNFALRNGNVGAFWGGVSLGVVFGIVLLSIFYHSVSMIVAAIKSLRDDPADRILVEYHDALINLMQEADGPVPCAADMPTPQESLSSNESHA
jgi:hypothetical protein